MKKKLVLLTLLFFAIFVRFYELGAIPHGITWDEAAIGYNGYATFTNKTDEWLEKMPVSFRSFGDYKAPGAIYFNGFFTYLFGMNTWAVRFPFALSGVISVIIFYFLLQTIYRENRHRELLSIAGATLITFSPWHIHFSRLGFESGISLLLLLVSLSSFISYIKNKEQPHSLWQKFLLPLAVISAVGSIYAYHSAKITTPLVLLAVTFLFLNKKDFMGHWKRFLLAILIGIVLLLPMLLDSIYGQGATRASVLIFSETGSVQEYVQIIFSNCLKIFSIDFLIHGKTDTLRHGTGTWGILFPSTALLCLFGLWYGMFQIWKKRYGYSFKITLFSILFLLFGILPALITRDATHPNRALLALPGFLLLAVQGIEFLILIIKKYVTTEVNREIASKISIGLFICLYLISFVSYWNYYLTIFSQESAQAFQDGYLEAFSIAEEYEKGKNGKPIVEKILFSNQYGQPYIFALFVRKTHPVWYQGGSLEKYEFTDRITSADLQRKATFVVATQNNLLDTSQADHLVYGSDGTVRFALYLSKGM